MIFNQSLVSMSPYFTTVYTLLGVIVLLCTEHTTAGWQCPSGWFLNSQNGHCYKLVYYDYGKQDQADAKARCLAEGGYLVQIQDLDELEYLAERGRYQSPGTTELFWTGGTRVDDNWVWDITDEMGNVEQIPMLFWKPKDHNDMVMKVGAALSVSHGGVAGHVGVLMPQRIPLSYICEQLAN